MEIHVFLHNIKCLSTTDENNVHTKDEYFIKRRSTGILKFTQSCAAEKKAWKVGCKSCIGKLLTALIHSRLDQAIIYGTTCSQVNNSDV